MTAQSDHSRPQHGFLGMSITPLTRRRIDNFKANRRGLWSLWIFLVLFVISLFAEFIANDKPFLVYYDGGFYMPIFEAYPETTFGGVFETEADYSDPAVRAFIDEKGWMMMPLVPYGYQSVAWDLRRPPMAATGSAPTIRPATWSLEPSTVSGSRFCSASL